MSEMDFDAVLADFKYTECNPRKLSGKAYRDDRLRMREDWLDENEEAILTALRLAKRVQSGEVSSDMHHAGIGANAGPRTGLHGYIFKAMSQQLMKEVQDEN